MKNLYRFAALLLLAAMLLVSCAQSPSVSIVSDSSLEPVLSDAGPPVAGAQIAFFSTEDDFESPFAQAAWATIGRFAGEEGFTSTSYNVEANNEESALAALELAAKSGAKLVVSVGNDTATMLQKIQYKYLDIDFIYFHAGAEANAGANAAHVRFSPKDGGWLAGYAAVQNGFLNIAYFESENEDAQLYALGFLLGAEAAATERELAWGTLRAFSIPSVPEETTEELIRRIDSYFMAGVELVFPNDPAWQPVALTAASTAEAEAITINLDPASSPSSPIFASIHHDPKAFLGEMLAEWRQGRLPTGSEVMGTVKNESVSLVWDEELAAEFSTEQYEAAVARFTTGNLERELDEVLARDENGLLPTPWALPLEILVIL